MRNVVRILGQFLVERRLARVVRESARVLQELPQRDAAPGGRQGRQALRDGVVETEQSPSGQQEHTAPLKALATLAIRMASYGCGCSRVARSATPAR